jgi:hypothetical protein
MTWRDREAKYNFVFCDDCSVVHKKGRDGDEDENDVEDRSRYGKSRVQLA